MTHLVKKFRKHKIMGNPKSYRMPHPAYKKQDIENIKPTYREPKGIIDKMAKFSVVSCRFVVDKMTFYNVDTMKEK